MSKARQDPVVVVATYYTKNGQDFLDSQYIRRKNSDALQFSSLLELIIFGTNILDPLDNVHLNVSVIRENKFALIQFSSLFLLYFVTLFGRFVYFGLTVRRNTQPLRTVQLRSA